MKTKETENKIKKDKAFVNSSIYDEDFFKVIFKLNRPLFLLSIKK